MSAINAAAVSLVDINAYCTALQQQKVTKAEFIQFASSRQTDTGPLLQLMVNGTLTMPEVSAIISSQQALAATPARQPGALHFKVSDKGAVSVYGLQSRFQRYPSPQLPIVPPDYLEAFGPFWGDILCQCEDRFPEMFGEGAYPEDPAKAAQPWPSPRSWTNVGRLLAAADSVGADAVTKNALIKGCVGEAAGTQFQRFVTSLQLPDPEELLAQPHTLKLPQRFDLSRAIISAVIGRIRAQATPQRWEAAYDLLEVAFGQQPETAMASEGALWKLKPDGHMPRVRNGAAAEMRSLRLVTAA